MKNSRINFDNFNNLSKYIILFTKIYKYIYVILYYYYIILLLYIIL